MSDLFKDRVQTGMTKERILVIAAAYAGSSDAVTDLANVKAEVDKLFNPLWFEIETDTVDQLTYTVKDDGGVADFVDTYGVIDPRIVPFVERQDSGAGAFVVVDEDEYTVNRTNGEIVFSIAQGASDVIRVSLCGNIPGGQSFEGAGKINLSTNKVLVLGQTKEAYKFVVDEGADPTFSFDAVVDVGKRHNPYPGEQVLKMIYGDDWTAAVAGGSGADFSANAVWNEFKSNSDPFFCAWVYISGETDAGLVKCKMELFRKCKLDEFPTTKKIGTGNDVGTVTVKGTADSAYHAMMLNA
jgi:hypothetical protein